jgi:hypothetical protein
VNERLPFTQTNLRRAIKVARETGLYIIAIKSDGTILVQDGDKAEATVPNLGALLQNTALPPVDEWEDVEA